jgi:putative membrane protein
MILIILAAGLHYLALGIGLGALFARGLHFRGLRRPGSDQREELKSAFLSDNFWGLAALLWITTGLLRLFGGLEKSRDFYFHNPFFFIKMGLFVLVFILEITPMVTLFKWRLQSRKKGKLKMPKEKLGLLILLNNLELALLVLIPFVAAAMARGVLLTP